MSILVHLIKDREALTLFIIPVTICILTFIFCSTAGILLSIFFFISLSLTFGLFITIETTSCLTIIQEHIGTFLNPQASYNNTNSSKNKILQVTKGFDEKIDQFLNKLLQKFISSWYSNVDSFDDDTFLFNLKSELAYALRQLCERYMDLDFPIILTRLLSVVFSHFLELEQSIKENANDEKTNKSFLDNGKIHPAIKNRKSELRYLRSISENLMSYLFTSNSFNCRAAHKIVRELIANWIFLPLTDIICDPDFINLLVIVATNETTNKFELHDNSQVELLANFIKKKETKINESDQNVDGKFFKDQEKLYNFMQYLKSKNCVVDVEILKFVLDVEKLNSESNVICNPKQLSNLQQLSEKLFHHYRYNLCKDESDKLPTNLIQSYDHAKKYLEHKFNYDFYKSADYYKYVYGDKDINKMSFQEKEEPLDVQSMSNQKLSAKIKNAMSMKIAVDGIEECDIQVWNGIDSSPIHYYNSMTVKLRKEKGQDLENFMHAFFQSIEQEADLGEDVVEIEAKKDRQNNQINLTNIELYQNIFNTSRESSYTVRTFLSPTQCFMYFLTKVMQFHITILRIFIGILNFLPNTDRLICMSIRKVANKLINEAILAHLINELEEKLFNSRSQQHRFTSDELLRRKNIANERLDKIKKGFSTNLLQFPILNKSLVYSLLDIIIIEGFKELIA